MIVVFIRCDMATHLPGYVHCSSDYAKRQSQKCLFVCLFVGLSVCFFVLFCLFVLFVLCVCLFFACPFYLRMCVCVFGCAVCMMHVLNTVHVMMMLCF